MGSTPRILLVALAAALSLGAGESEAQRTAAAPEASVEAAPPVAERPALNAPSPEPAPAAETDRVSQALVYQPPRRGTPRARVGGGVRGSKALPTPLALVPDHLALTTREAPSLFWHIDDAPPSGVDLVFVFTLIGEEAVQPLVETELAPPPRAGIYRIRLADHGVALEPDVEYGWSVSLVVDPEQRALDVVSTGYLMRVQEPDGLVGRQPTPALYARLGLWYDALESLSDAIDAAPQDPVLRAQRASLLRQATLEPAIE